MGVTAQIRTATPYNFLLKARLFAVCMIGSAAAGIIIRGGRFTFCFKCCLSEKGIVDASTRSLKFWSLPIKKDYGV